MRKARRPISDADAREETDMIETPLLSDARIESKTSGAVPDHSQLSSVADCYWLARELAARRRTQRAPEMITILNLLASASLEPGAQARDDLEFIRIVTVLAREVGGVAKLP
ncbi:hypothetical protein GCM10011487_52790 [Steroidobacter agaridevorans]|uniref:Uncharacterized protein n=1 Tax=Steroidobacter agaridevorans TaxID=2695856 RepID=A0A829YJA9_9GAMM|nr:hypothetical protein GCM10011487_52790 [Steroidobacter agaridevorans]GFE86825.1 hypothetical protein GCM10011488_17790 [Steroidobacter agaridevorans]